MAMNREEDEELQMALRMSLQSPPPEAKRSKPGASASIGDESPEARNRRTQRELMAAAAEKRLRAMGKTKVGEDEVERSRKKDELTKKEGTGENKVLFEPGEELSFSVVEELFGMIFGVGVTRDVLAQWCNQGIRSGLYWFIVVIFFISQLLTR
jgi:ubiquitin carboxyl-terminal hydrolase MINDY-3/4